LEEILNERMEGNSWKREWERGVGEMFGLKGFKKKRGWEGIVERGWYGRDGRENGRK
jgi:hypothetical protein